jgi:hypothetical protein
MGAIKESDWRLLRQLKDVALERFCERVLKDIARRSSASRRTYHERYIEIHRLLERRDREVAEAFNGLRRSTAVQQLTVMYSLKLLTDAELARFSPDTRDAVEQFLRLVTD